MGLRLHDITLHLMRLNSAPSAEAYGKVETEQGEGVLLGIPRRLLALLAQACPGTLEGRRHRCSPESGPTARLQGEP